MLLKWRLTWVLAVMLGLTLPSSAQDADEEEDDLYNRPAEAGLRFTPGMARALGKVYAKEVLVRRYELDAAKADEAAELAARRMMKLAHGTEDQGQEFVEYLFTQIMKMNSDGSRRGGGPPFDAEFGRGIAERVLPLLPSVREMINGTVDDIRPMLPFKGQMKMTAEVAMVNTAIGTFEGNMQKWSKGDVDFTRNPFEPAEEEVKKDEHGESQVLKSARRSAEAQTGSPGAGWGQYVEEAKKYYGFDASQAAAADSILRECKERAAALVGDSTQQTEAYRNRLWVVMSSRFRGGWNNPLRMLLEEDFLRMRAPLVALGDELKRKIDDLATQGQRDAAQKRMDELLRQKGFAWEDEPAAATQEAADVAGSLSVEEK